MGIKHLLKTTALTALLVIAGKVGWGQVAITAFGTPYTQNFNSLANTGTTNTWTDNTTIAGWYSSRTVYVASDGSSNSGALYSFGSTGSTERAIGGVCSSSTSTIYYGCRFVNNTGSAISSLTITYDGEQWRNGGNTAAQPLTFSYQVGATALTTGTWTSVSQLTFTSLIGTTTAAPLDGNSAANRTAGITYEISGINVANGQEVWIRWEDINDSGNDHGLAIDNLSVTAAADTQAPTLSSVVPTDNATNVGINTTLSVTLNENVAKGTGNILVKKVTDNSTVYSIDVTSSNVSISGKTATITLPGFLANGIEYYVIVPAGCLTDLASNSFAGITGTTDWTFTTTSTPVSTVRLDYPNGGEKLYGGQSINVTWTATSDIANVKIEYSSDNGTSWSTLVASTAANTGSVSVSLPSAYSALGLIRISDVDVASTNDISNANFTIVAVAADLATLKAMAAGTVVKYTGKATVTFARNSATYYYQKYIQDATDAVLIYDNNTATPYVATTYAIGDGITNVEGKITIFNNLVELVPQATTGEPTTGNPTITPEVRTIASLTSNDQSKLVKLVNYTFTAPTGNFSSGSSYAVSQSGTDFLVTAFAFRASFAEADYITTPTAVPTTAITTVGIVGVYNAVIQYTPRFKSDIKSAVATITSTTYTIDQGTGVISNVPYTIDIATFKSKLTASSTNWNVYDSDGTTPASVVDNTKKVIITSEDGLATKTYTITKIAASTDATLSNLTSDGTQVPSFTAGTLNYNIELPYGTSPTAIPTVVATKNNANAVVGITYATDLAGDAAARTTTVLVTAEDGSTTKTYTIVYTIAAPKTDKTLLSLKVDGNTVAGFSPSILAYSVELPVGTTTVPTVTATKNDPTATVEITQAQNVTGSQIERTASVKVIAQDLSEQTYTVEFTVAIPGTDATLSDLKINGVTVTGFAALTTTYNVALAAGTTTVPTVTVTTNDAVATYEITPATNLTGTEAERTTTIVVTAENTSFTKTYTVIFRVKSDNDNLSALTYDGTSVPSFDASTLSYNVVLPHSHGTTSVPVVAATKAEANASVSITQAANLTGTEAERTATVVVTADDNTYTKTYTIVFSVAKDTDAKLTGITYDGTAVSGFVATTLNYYVTLAYGTTAVPVVAVTKSDVNANANIVQAQNVTGTTVERTATITVTAEDGIATKVYTVTFRVDNVAKELFFSEYIEGTGNNKGFEIYNPFSVAVDLSGYNVRSSHDGAGWGAAGTEYYLTFPAGTMIAPGDVYVVTSDYTGTNNNGIAKYGDWKLTYGTDLSQNQSKVVYFTGNDALGLFKGSTLVDVFGDVSSSTTFDVAGVTGAAVDHSIVRKPTVHKGNTSWSSSAGTNADNSEWIVNGVDIFTNLGSHTTNPTDPTLTVSATSLADFGSIISGTVGRGEASFTVSGSLLSNDIVITAPAGFQISKSSGTNFVSEGPITLAQTSGTVAATTIYVKFNPQAVQAYSDFITVSTEGITPQQVAVSGTGVATDDMPPSFTEGPSYANVEPYKFDVKFKVDEGGKVYIVKLASGSTEPSSTLVITDPNAVVVNVVPGTLYTQTFSGLTKNTAYDLYFVAGDNQATTNISGATKLTVTTLDIPVVTIHDIQYTTDAAGNSPKMNTWVETTGIVTAVKGTSGFFMQSATGAWNGIYVYNTATVAVGDVVKVTGKVIENYKVTAFESTSVVENQNSPTTVPDPVVVTTLGANDEQYEGVFVKVNHANCASGSAGSYVVNDGSGTLTVYKGIYSGLSLTIGTKYNIQGVMDYYNSSSTWELYPRSEADVVDATGVNDNPYSNLNVYPNPFSNEIKFDGVQNVMRIVITSITGQVVKNETVVSNTVNTESLPQGMYLVTLFNDKGEKATLKMIKQ